MQYSAPVVEQNNNNEIKKGREYNEKKERESKSRIPCACYGVVVCSTLYTFLRGEKILLFRFHVKFPYLLVLPPRWAEREMVWVHPRVGVVHLDCLQTLIL